MFSKIRSASAFAIAMMTMGDVNASHLDDIDGVFSNFKFDVVKFKTQTNCSLDKYPEVSSHFKTIWQPLVSQDMRFDIDTNTFFCLD